jgi:hypothetical protein
MSRPPGRPAIGIIRFTRRMAAQCFPAGLGPPDWVVCDTIANGEREPVGRRGPQGGPLVRFVRTFPERDPSRPATTVRVLGEMTRNGCFAVALLSPAAVPGKNWEDCRFFNRSASK